MADGRAALRRLLGDERAIALAALLLGIALVGLYDAALAPSRYPYSGDSASYIEMASSLRATGQPRVTPWEVSAAEPDAVPQPLFPPGFAVVVAALVPLAGDARAAALWPGRIAAALLPWLLVVMWRGAAPPGVLLFTGLWVLLSPGVRRWQFVAYSDVPMLALAVIALGALARALADRAPAGRARDCLLAGLVAGLAYTVRNAALALLVASLAALLYAHLRREVGVRPLALFAAGAAVPVGALTAYNLLTFGTAWPYAMPPSARPWPQNLLDYAAAQLEEVGSGAGGDLPLPAGIALAVLGILIALGALAWWRSRAERVRHLRLTLLGAYAVGGGLLLVASRSRYEWGNYIDERNVLQYSFALVLAAFVALGWPQQRRQRRAAGALLAALLASRAYAVVREAASARSEPPESWLALDRDSVVMAAVRAYPPGTLVASNAAVLFRIGGPRPVRQLDVGGEDGDFAGSLAVLAAAARPRPAAFLLVCNEWTGQLSACGGRPAAGAPACTRLRARDPIVARCEVTPVSGVPFAPGTAASGAAGAPDAS